MSQQPAANTAQRLTPVASDDRERCLHDAVQTVARYAEATNGNRSQAEGLRWTAKTLENLGRQLDDTLATFDIKHSAAQRPLEVASPATQSESGPAPMPVVATTSVGLDASQLQPSE